MTVIIIKMLQSYYKYNPKNKSYCYRISSFLYNLCFPTYYQTQLVQYQQKLEFQHDFEFLIEQCQLQKEDIEVFSIPYILQLIVEKRNNNEILISNPLKYCYKINLIDKILLDFQTKYKYQYTLSSELNDYVYQYYKKTYDHDNIDKIQKQYLFRPVECKIDFY